VSHLQRLIIPLISLLLAATPLHAQQKSEASNVEQFDDWSKVCRKPASEKAASCYMQQAVRSPDEGKKDTPAFVWRLTKAEGGRLNSVAVTPIGVLLTAGLSFEFSSEKATALPYRTCTPGFCEAVFTLEPDLVKSLSGRKSIKASFRMADGRVVNMDLSLIGLQKGLASIK
jgi:invasion protein IalB